MSSLAHATSLAVQLGLLICGCQSKMPSSAAVETRTTAEPDVVREHNAANERATRSAAAAHRSATTALVHGDAWTHHRMLRGCVSIDGERVEDGFVVLAPNHGGEASRVAPLVAGCYALRLPRDAGDAALMTVLRTPATGKFVHEVPAGTVRFDVALSSDEFVPIEIELIVDRRVTRERVQLSVCGGRQPYDERFARHNDDWNLVAAAQEDCHVDAPAPQRGVVAVQRGHFLVYASSGFSEADKHLGIEHGVSHAMRVNGGPWRIEPWITGPLSVFDTATDTQITLFVCRSPAPECDVLPP